MNYTLGKSYRWIIYSLVCISVSSCAVFKSAPPPLNAQLSKDTRIETLAKINQWHLSGQIAVRSPENSWSAHVDWQQHLDQYTILLSAPLGAYSVSLKGNSAGVILKTAEGKEMKAASPEALIAAQTPWRLPVSSLSYWIRGMPIPGQPFTAEYDSYQHILTLKQTGWVIHYLRYTAAQSIDLPSKIFIANPEWHIKIIISDWQL